MSATRVLNSCMDAPDDSVDLVPPKERIALQKKLKLSEENKENITEITDQGENGGNAKVNHLAEGKGCFTLDNDFTNSLVRTFVLLVIFYTQ